MEWEELVNGKKNGTFGFCIFFLILF